MKAFVFALLHIAVFFCGAGVHAVLQQQPFLPTERTSHEWLAAVLFIVMATMASFVAYQVAATKRAEG